VSEVELGSNDVSADTGSEEKLVPVAEAIRYRKRAQSAEKEAAGLTEEVSRLREANGRLSAEVEELRTDGALTAAFVSAGVVDLEAAMLMARSRMEKEEGLDATAVAEALRKEKGYLFGARSGPTASGKTAGVKEKGAVGPRVLEDAARQAAASGSRVDVHEYMRRRRKLV